MALCTSPSSIITQKKKMKNAQVEYKTIQIPQLRTKAEELIALQASDLHNNMPVTETVYSDEQSLNMPFTVINTEINTGNVCQEFKKKYIAADNLDLLINPHFISGSRQRQSLHWFIEVEIDKRITADNLATSIEHDKQILCSSWLPTNNEIDTFQHNLNYHILKVLIKFTFISQYEHLIPQHILHPFIDKTSQKSDYKVIDLMDANENKSDGIIEIMKNLHETYVPRRDGEILATTELAGDVLTNERAFSAQINMMNGDNSFQRLAGFNHRPGGLHLLMNLTTVAVYTM